MAGPNEKRKPEDRFVSWGMHTGKKFRNVPTQYLIWFIKNSYSQMQDRRRWAKDELIRRGITDNNLIYKDKK